MWNSVKEKSRRIDIRGKNKSKWNNCNRIRTKINPSKDIVEYNNKVIEPEQRNVYILLNKPIGYVTTVKDQFNRPSVLDLVKVKERIVPVGRLDFYTSGALILSNDGILFIKLLIQNMK